MRETDIEAEMTSLLDHTVSHGIGETQGIDFSRKNLENILTYGVKHVEYIVRW